MILHSLKHTTAQGSVPEKMNNPFDYEPHPLCISACKELQAQLAGCTGWREEIDKGKMFGVLIVSKDGETGYLTAYSGQIGGRSDWEGFVPAVFDYLQPGGHFKTREAEITRINHSISQMEKDPWMKKAQAEIAALLQSRQQAIALHQTKMKEAKARRDMRRSEGPLTDGEEKAMTKESQFMKAELRRIKKTLAEKTAIEREYDERTTETARLRRLRKELSDSLQQWLFSQFRMLNPMGQSKDLLEIFRDTAAKIPPAGSGECCEPKLLQYAYRHGYKPLQMAMFWWGESPKEEIRHHLQYYPACQGKCKPILEWMLPKECFQTKISTTNGPIYNKVEETELPNLETGTLYDDHELAVIVKPAGLLSVPGKDNTAPSVYSIMRKKYPEATGPLIVHRLDMATSGLMVIAKTEFAYRQLQKQFAAHRVQKKYVALVCCKDKIIHDKIVNACIRSREKRPTISLPLLPDYLDRPRQIVNCELGKRAVTEYTLLPGNSERPYDSDPLVHEDDGTEYLRLALFPKTGRTHQLRVHCAHQKGLNAPILGDPLYGNVKASRLYLHAEEITFEHPLTRELLNFRSPAEF